MKGCRKTPEPWLGRCLPLLVWHTHCTRLKEDSHFYRQGKVTTYMTITSSFPGARKGFPCFSMRFFMQTRKPFLVEGFLTAVTYWRDCAGSIKFPLASPAAALDVVGAEERITVNVLLYTCEREEKAHFIIILLPWRFKLRTPHWAWTRTKPSMTKQWSVYEVLHFIRTRVRSLMHRRKRLGEQELQVCG